MKYYLYSADNRNGFRVKENDNSYHYIDPEGYTLDIRPVRFGIFIFAPGQGVSLDTDEVPWLIMDLILASKMSGMQILDVVDSLLDYVEDHNDIN